jgi:hypothetical protein
MNRTIVVTALGTMQTPAWASSYCLPAIFADPIAQGTGVSRMVVFGLFSGARLLSAVFGPGAVMAFAVLHGAGNGPFTIARGAVPLAIFGPIVWVANGTARRAGLRHASHRTVPLWLAARPAGGASIAISTGLCLAAFLALFLLKARAEPAPVTA